MSRIGNAVNERQMPADTAMRQERGQFSGSAGKQIGVSRLKVAIVHDWLVGGGAERVVEQLHLLYPDAPIYTSFCSDEWRKRLDGEVVTGFLQRWPFSKLRKFTPFLRAWWFSRLDLSKFDLVISSSGAEAKGVKTPKGTLHINYCHAPTHYYWDRYEDYLRHPGFGSFDWLARAGLKMLVGPMRRWDYKAAQRPNHMIANSLHTKNKIKEYYGRDAVVIHPPVNTHRFITNSQIKRSGFVTASRQTPYKKIDLAVKACSELNLPLTVIGSGPDHEYLKNMAGPSVSFVKNPSDEAVAQHFQAAEAFIFPSLDDFGIVAVEAIAAGTPVIAFKDGGALDYVEDGKTGLFFDHQTTESLKAALKRFQKHKFSPALIATSAEKFSAEKFRKNIKSQIESTLP